MTSHPSLDEWIEMKELEKLFNSPISLILHWMSGLKCLLKLVKR